MKVLLKYRRGTRPRGSWRFPLWFTIGVHYTAEEIDNLNPDWSFTKSYSFQLAHLHDVSKHPKKVSLPLQHYEVQCFSPLSYDGSTCGWAKGMTSLQFKVGYEEGCKQDVDANLYFNFQEDRDRFVEILHEIQGDLILFTAAWWKAHPDVPGDNAESVKEVCFDPSTGQIYDFQTQGDAPESTVVKVDRRIRPHI